MIQDERGFTLIELMVAIALSAVIIVVAYDVFISQQRAYSVQDQVVEMHQNARAAMDLMIREVRMAGHQTSPQPQIDPNNTNNTSIHFYSDLYNNQRELVSDGDTCDPNEDITFSFANNTIFRTNFLGNRNDCNRKQRIQPLAENIIGLQFMYGLDVNGPDVNGDIITEIGAIPDDDEWVFNVPGDTVAGTIAALGGTGTINDYLVLVRISITARTARPDPNWTVMDPNCPAGFRCRTLTANVKLRNLGID